MPKVLVIDDSISVRKTIAQMLGPRGLQVASCASGYEAVARLRAEAPDLVICDLVLPDADGYQVCRWLRQLPDLAATPVLLTSHIIDETVEREVARLGIAGLVKKPLAGDELAATAERILAAKLRPALPVEMADARGGAGAAAGREPQRGGTGGWKAMPDGAAGGEPRAAEEGARAGGRGATGSGLAHGAAAGGIGMGDAGQGAIGMADGAGAPGTAAGAAALGAAGDGSDSAGVVGLGPAGGGGLGVAARAMRRRTTGRFVVPPASERTREVLLELGSIPGFRHALLLSPEPEVLTLTGDLSPLAAERAIEPLAGLLTAAGAAAAALGIGGGGGGGGGGAVDSLVLETAGGPTLLARQVDARAALILVLADSTSLGKARFALGRLLQALRDSWEAG